MLILLYILLVLSAIIWAAVGYCAFVFMTEADGRRTDGALLVAVLCGLISATLLGMLIWFLTAHITIVH